MFSWESVELILRLILDILIVWALIFAGMRIIRNNNRTIQIVKGILTLFLLKLIAGWMQLNTVVYLLDVFLNWGVLFVLVILQPEIRAMLEKMGKTNSAFASNLPAERIENMIDQVVTAMDDMSRTKTGALITLQMNQSLEDYEKTGIPVDSDVTSEMLETIFQYGTPMHDGAVIIEGDKLAAAAAYFPSTSQDLPSKYGARHRAAVGISEVSDSITLVVSEETGNISVAQKGKLTQFTPETLRRYLKSRLLPDNDKSSSIMSPVIQSARNLTSNLSQRNKARAKEDDRVTPVEVVDNLSGKEDDHHG